MFVFTLSDIIGIVALTITVVIFAISTLFNYINKPKRNSK